MSQEIQSSAFHELTKEIKEILLSKDDLLKKWNSLTPIQRNEWICWITMPKKQETKDEHLKRFQEEISNGKKRPCCWPGCPHRNQNSKKYFK